MNLIKIDLNNPKKEDIKIATKYFKDNKIIIYPTDTIYGIGCLAHSEEAVSGIMGMKKRKKKGFIVLMKDMEMARKYCKISKEQKEFMEKNSESDRPTTFVLKASSPIDFPEDIYGDGASLAIRLPKMEFLTKILVDVNEPIVSTSLNISGESEIDNLENIEKYFGGQADLGVDAGIITNKQASRIIDISDINDVKIIRN